MLFDWLIDLLIYWLIVSQPANWLIWQIKYLSYLLIQIQSFSLPVSQSAFLRLLHFQAYVILKNIYLEERHLSTQETLNAAMPETNETKLPPSLITTASQGCPIAKEHNTKMTPKTTIHVIYYTVTCNQTDKTSEA